jgi:hypothetical protein
MVRGAAKQLAEGVFKRRDAKNAEKRAFEAAVMNASGRQLPSGRKRGEAFGVRLPTCRGRFLTVGRARKREQAPALQTLRAQVRRFEKA